MLEYCISHLNCHSCTNAYNTLCNQDTRPDERNLKLTHFGSTSVAVELGRTDMRSDMTESTVPALC